GRSQCAARPAQLIRLCGLAGWSRAAVTCAAAIHWTGPSPACPTYRLRAPAQWSGTLPPRARPRGYLATSLGGAVASRRRSCVNDLEEPQAAQVRADTRMKGCGAGRRTLDSAKAALLTKPRPGNVMTDSVNLRNAGCGQPGFRCQT